MQLTEQIGMVLLVFALLGGLLWFSKRRGLAAFSIGGRGAKRAAHRSIGTRLLDAPSRFAFGTGFGSDGVDRNRSVFV